MRIFVMMVLCLALAAPAFAGMYKWKDKNGKIHFTDNPSQIPPDYRNKKTMKKMESIEGGGPSNLPRGRAATPARKHLGAKKEGSGSKGTGIDKQKVRDLQRLIQKKHYDH
jgi:hypothetical protein